MIVSRLIGGLGNQMFQYAVGRALAFRLGVPFAIDRRDFVNYRLHAYGLQNFILSVDDPPTSILPCPPDVSHLRKFLTQLIGGSALKMVTEKAATFDPSVPHLPDNVYLNGYWQSERYFSDISSVIREDFQVKHLPSSANSRWLKLIGDRLSVSVHVRRGDYVDNPKTNKFHGLCGLDYYERAINEMRLRLESNPVFFIFSDDQIWARNNLDFDGCESHFICDNDAALNYEDLRLMVSCRHHIIANSSFSWWGAWLNPRSDKNVIAPDRWFLEKIETKDLIPDAWIRL